MLRLATVVLFIAVVSGLAGLEESAQANSRHELVSRFELRGTSASAFLQSYTGYVLSRERTLAEQLLATPVVSNAQFQNFLTIMGFGPSVLLDSSGRDLQVAPYTASVIGTDLAQRYAHLASAVAGQPAVSNVVASAAQHVPVVAFATPFDTPSGRRVISGAFDLSSRPMGIYLHHILPYSDGAVYLVDRADQVITSSLNQTGSLASLAPSVARAVATGRPVGSFTAGAGVDSTFAVAPVDGTPWRLVMAVPTGTLLEPITPASRILPWVLLAAFAAAAAGLLIGLARTHKAKAEAIRVSRTDPLTRIANRRATVDTLERLLVDHRRYDTGLGLLIFDIDHFKAINDRFGHASGDAVLVEVANRATVALRETDTIGRWGGEEFVALLPHTDRAGVVAAAERVREALDATPVQVGGRTIAVTASVGGTVIGGDDDADMLLSRADGALYSAKESGRNRCIVTETVPA